MEHAYCKSMDLRDVSEAAVGTAGFYSKSSARESRELARMKRHGETKADSKSRFLIKLRITTQDNRQHRRRHSQCRRDMRHRVLPSTHNSIRDNHSPNPCRHREGHSMIGAIRRTACFLPRRRMGPIDSKHFRVHSELLPRQSNRGTVVARRSSSVRGRATGLASEPPRSRNRRRGALDARNEILCVAKCAVDRSESSSLRAGYQWTVLHDWKPFEAT